MALRVHKTLNVRFYSKNLVDQDVYARVRSTLSALAETAAKLGPAHHTSVRAAMRDMDAPFSLACVGNYSAGKSTIVNALLGQDVTPEGRGVTTSVIHRIQYGTKTSLHEDEFGEMEVACDSEWLRDHPISLIDTPGIGASNQQHQEISFESTPHCDLVLLVTTVENMLSGRDEHLLLESLGTNREVAVVINRIDHVENSDEVAEIVAKTTENAKPFLRGSTVYFPLSAKLAKDAIKARKEGDDQSFADLWARSKFQDVVDHLNLLLENDDRKFIKLTAPLDQAKRLVDQLRKEFAVEEANLRKAADDLQDNNAKFAAMGDVMSRHLDAELARTDPHFKDAAMELKASLPSAFGATFGASLKGKERSQFQFIPTVKEQMSSFMRDAQKELDTANEHVLDALKAIAKQHPNVEEEMMLLHSDATRLGDAGAHVDRGILSTRLDALVDASFDENGVFTDFDITRFRRRLSQQVIGSYVTSLLGVTGVVVLGDYAGLTTAGFAGGIGGCGSLAICGTLWMKYRWASATKRLEATTKKLQSDMGTQLQKELVKGVSSAVLPLRDVVSRARDVLHAQQSVISDAQRELIVHSSSIDRLQSDIARELASIRSKPKASR